MVCSSEVCSLGASRVTCGSSRLDIVEMSPSRMRNESGCGKCKSGRCRVKSERRVQTGKRAKFEFCVVGGGLHRAAGIESMMGESRAKCVFSIRWAGVHVIREWQIFYHCLFGR